MPYPIELGFHVKFSSCLYPPIAPPQNAPRHGKLFSASQSGRPMVLSRLPAVCQIYCLGASVPSKLHVEADIQIQ